MGVFGRLFWDPIPPNLESRPQKNAHETSGRYFQRAFVCWTSPVPVCDFLSILGGKGSVCAPCSRAQASKNKQQATSITGLCSSSCRRWNSVLGHLFESVQQSCCIPCYPNVVQLCKFKEACEHRLPATAATAGADTRSFFILWSHRRSHYILY